MDKLWDKNKTKNTYNPYTHALMFVKYWHRFTNRLKHKAWSWL